jgi:hypothetical protein
MWLYELDLQAEDCVLYRIMLLILLAQLWAFQLRLSQFVSVSISQTNETSGVS